MLKQINNLFQGLDRAHCGFVITHTENGKVQGKNYTKHEPVNLELWERHLNGDHGLGIIPITDDSTVKWGAIDIDDNSVNHINLEKKIFDFKLPLVLCRSKSGGAHLFLFLKDFVSAQDVRLKLFEWAGALGFRRAEIFPKQTNLANNQDTGNGLNMPYFGILGEQKQTLRYCIKDGKAIQDLQSFIDYAQSKRISYVDLLSVVIEPDKEFEDAPPCLQYLTREGLKDHRNNGLFSLGAFARKKFSDVWQQKIDEYNKEYVSPSLPSSEVQGIIKGLNKKSYFYKCKDEPLISHCNKDLCRKQKYGIDNDDDLDLDIVIDGLQKLKTDPPIWFLNVQGPDGNKQRLQIDDTKKLLSQYEFNIKCIEQLSVLPPLVKPKKWYNFISKALSTVEEIEAPMEASSYGMLFNMLQEHCTGRTQARDRLELKEGKPWLNDKDDCYYFRSDTFFNYVQQKGARWFKGWTVPKFYSVLKSQGVLPVQLHGVGRVWKIELDKFDRKVLTEDDIPETNIKVDDEVPF